MDVEELKFGTKVWRNELRLCAKFPLFSPNRLLTKKSQLTKIGFWKMDNFLVQFYFSMYFVEVKQKVNGGKVGAEIREQGGRNTFLALLVFPLSGLHISGHGGRWGGPPAVGSRIARLASLSLFSFVQLTGAFFILLPLAQTSVFVCFSSACVACVCPSDNSIRVQVTRTVAARERCPSSSITSGILQAPKLL